MPPGTTLRNVRIDDDRWSALRTEAVARGSDASQVIRDLIDLFLSGDVMPPPAQDAPATT